ncbi:hypothetical protein R9X47_07110 [Wukongibacter baidiensis]|uniref:hypothetical protein n=1 Tax=Wukongibacter baidiensis TaxID=1723361 RepID=UPI003D7FD8F5
MISIEVCIGCNSKKCCSYKKGIELYEFLKDDTTKLINVDIEISMKKCSCKEECNGPIVRIDGSVYTNVDKAKALNIIKRIVLTKGSENYETRNTEN